MRYAAYLRISSEEQLDNFSIDAQHRAVEEWVKSQGSLISRLYIDEVQSGTTTNRPEFLAMRRDAQQRKFDALVVHRFDRFARNRTDALAIKSLLRQDYGIKVFSVTEPSEDSDGPIGMLVEGIMECVADWYSRNLAAETTKGKPERALQGYHNNRAPFGFDKDDDGVLINNDYELKGLCMAFDLYNTTLYSDHDIAHVLNEEGYRVKGTGKLFTGETIRGMLQNRIYLGYVKYQPYKKDTNGRRVKSDVPEQWIKGKHHAVIDADLFEQCQQIRYAKATHHEYYPKHRTYLLRDIIFCAHCVANMPSSTQDDNYGKMRPHTHYNGEYRLYRCRARDYSRTCPQGSVHADVIEQQVINILKNLKPPLDWQYRMVSAMGERLSNQKLEERVKEIKQVIERMDFRWDYGFITDRHNYLSERVRLQQELEILTPVANDEVETAANLLQNFAQHWEALNGDRKKQQQLIQLIVTRVWVRGNNIAAISLRPDYHIIISPENE